MTHPDAGGGSALPLPPEPLRVRVGASRDERVFRDVGRALADTIASLAPGLAARDERDRPQALDFGCGCARVLRHLASTLPHVCWHGADIDGEAIQWCRQQLPGLAAWSVCDEWPPLSYGDRSFDVIFSVSVFTHIPEAMQLAWLRELDRILKPDGVAILSVYNQVIHEILPGQLRRQLRDTGILYGFDGGTAGLPDSYQSCFHTRDYVLATWSRRFHIERCVDRAFLSSQDAIVLRKRVPNTRANGHRSTRLDLTSSRPAGDHGPRPGARPPRPAAGGPHAR